MAERGSAAHGCNDPGAELVDTRLGDDTMDRPPLLALVAHALCCDPPPKEETARRAP
jgi:hypothetical protein